MIDHTDLGSDLLYHLALVRFVGGSELEDITGEEGRDINVAEAIGHGLKFKEDTASGSVMEDSGTVYIIDTNQDLESQAATCLLEKAEMLEDYFNIKLFRGKREGTGRMRRWKERLQWC